MEAGHVTSFTQIFDHIPLSVFAIDFGSNYVRLNG